jgi:stage III sporulation protein AB
MYIRILGAFLVIGSSTGIGIYFGNSIKDRLEKLRMIKQQMMIIRGDISYGNTCLPEVMEAVGDRLSRENGCPEFAAFYQQVSLELKEKKGIPFQQIWEKAVEENLGKTTLQEQDLQLLSSLGSQLGYLDRTMQLKTIDLFLERLEEELAPQVQKAGEKMRLCKTLGLMAGIFLVVVMF